MSDETKPKKKYAAPIKKAETPSSEFEHQDRIVFSKPEKEEKRKRSK